MDIIELAKNFGKELQKTDEYLNLVEAKKNNDNDQELSNLIGEYNLLKFDIGRLLADYQDKQEKIDQKNAELKEIYDKIMKNSNMIAFNEASDKVNNMMNKINKILVAAVNGEDLTFDFEINESKCGGGGCENCFGCQ